MSNAVMPGLIRDTFGAGHDRWTTLLIVLPRPIGGNEMEFGLLGPLEVRRGGVVVPVRSGRQRAVLAALLLEANRVVPTERLAETLWGSRPPPSARVTLQNYVARLRRILGDADMTRISTRPGGYLIRVDHGQLDISRFGVLLDSARTAARHNSWSRAAAEAAAALALWRGEPLADVESGTLAAREIPMLAAMRLQALETRMDAVLHLGDHAGAIAELQRLVDAHPLREHLHALLMLALYRDGRQAEALTVYHHARAMLIDELGLEPGTELRGLHQQILTGDPALEIEAAASSGDSASGRRAAARTLPSDAAWFTGREQELAQLSGTAETGPAGVCTISGMPGVGKTALAVHAAHLLNDQFPDGQLFVDLHAHTPGQEPADPGEVLTRLLTAAGADARFLPADTQGRIDLWRDRMAGRRVLLVLDNAATSAQVAPLLPGGQGCLVLVTSRRHLGDVPGLAVPVLLEALPPGQAGEMFRRLATRTVADPSDAEVAEIARLSGYLPLAISLLARVYARHPSWTMADLVAETQASLLTLAAEHDSVAAAFEVSYRYLARSRQQFFDYLGLHLGTTVDAWAAAALAGIPLDEAVAHLDALHGEGLLNETSYRRYVMHDLIRRYSRGHAAARPNQALDRLLDYYQHAAATAEARLARQTTDPPAPLPPTRPPTALPDLSDYTRALAWSRDERANLAACLDYAASTKQDTRVIALTAAITALMQRDGPWDEALARHATAAQAARRLSDQPGEASALIHLAVARRLTGDYPGATLDLATALRIYRRCGHRLGQANALSNLGAVLAMCGDYPGGSEVLQQALGIYGNIGDKVGQAYALHYLGVVRRQTADYSGAAQALQEALGMFRDNADPLGCASSLTELASVWRRIGAYPSAVQALQEALGISRDTGDRLGQGDVLSDLGDVRRHTGDYLGAVQALQEALSIFRDTGIRLGQANALGYLGNVLRLTGDYSGASEALEAALGIFRDIGDRDAEATNLNDAGSLYRACGELDRAGDCHRQALSLSREIGSSHNEASALAGLGRCAQDAGRAAEAKAALEQANEIFQRIGAAEAVALAAEIDALA
jgi:DNA-binding SARP family transcriptional activator